MRISHFGLKLFQNSTSFSTQRLVLKNNVSDRVKIYQGSLPHHNIRPNTYDLAVANISSKVISELSNDLILATKHGGIIVISGILVNNSQDVKNSLVSGDVNLINAPVFAYFILDVAKSPTTKAPPDVKYPVLVLVPVVVETHVAVNELKSLAINYKDEKELEIDKLTDEINEFKIRIEESRDLYEETLDKTTKSIEKFIENAETDLEKNV